MAAQVPAALKAADLTRFAHRAAQLEKPKPIIAYWCMPPVAPCPKLQLTD